MTETQIRKLFQTLQPTPVELAQWEQGVLAAQTGQTEQPHWTRWQRAGRRTWEAAQKALHEQEVSYA